MKPWPNRALVLVVLIALFGLVLAWRLARRPKLHARPRPTAAAAGARPSSHRPNILLISLDTVRPDHLGCYGYAKATSPHLDRFARQAVRFSQVRAQAPWTLPSHMSVFTSMLPSSNRVDTMFLALPQQVPTLPELLQAAGYKTVGIVNNAGIESSWGFSRGFDRYEEYEPDKPDGKGDAITEKALRWLESYHYSTIGAAATAPPFFLFLHYYDAHDPYDSPEPFHSRFGALPRAETERLIREDGRPGHDFKDPRELTALIASYDAAIANLDEQVGRVLDHLPPDTLVVVFSDHGEAFKEHGWLWHGSTLYEEEIRTVLMVRYVAGPGNSSGLEGWGLGRGDTAAAVSGDSSRKPQGSSPASRVIDDPVMLMDIAPTILAATGIAAPPTFEGSDLGPLLSGTPLPPRMLAAETKAHREGELSKCLILPPWKLIYNMYNGGRELYKLPDEKTDHLKSEPAVLAGLWPPMQKWVDRETFWLIYFTGPGEFTGSLEASGGGQISSAIPMDLGRREGEDFDLVGDDKQQLQWIAKPGNGVEAMYIETIPPDAPLGATFPVDGQANTKRVWVGKTGVHPATMPSEFWIGPADLVPPPQHPRLSLGAQELLPPVMDGAFRPDQPGIYVRRFHGAASPQVGPGAPMLDRKTIEQLRTLGYL